MIDNPNVGADAQAGAEGSPSQPVSPQATQPISGDVMNLLTGLGERLTNLDSQLRGLQGRQDKSENSFRDQLAKLNQYKSQGLTDEQALTQMETVDATERRWQAMENQLKEIAGRIGNGGTQPSAQQSMTAVFEQIIGKDNLTNPLVASVISQQYKTVEEAQSAAYRLFHQLSTLPNPNAAQSASLQGGSGGARNLDALAAEYDTLAVNPSANFERMLQIQQEIDAATK